MHIPLLPPHFLYNALPMDFTAKGDTFLSWVAFWLTVFVTLVCLQGAIKTSYPGQPGIRGRLLGNLLTGTIAALGFCTLGLLTILSVITAGIIAIIVAIILVEVGRRIPGWAKGWAEKLQRLWLILVTPGKGKV